jgi:hypothetical protein
MKYPRLCRGIIITGDKAIKLRKKPAKTFGFSGLLA